jgi:hypothetical protein
MVRCAAVMGHGRSGLAQFSHALAIREVLYLMKFIEK